jgi:hypothetical protein
MRENVIYFFIFLHLVSDRCSLNVSPIWLVGSTSFRSHFSISTSYFGLVINDIKICTVIKHPHLAGLGVAKPPHGPRGWFGHPQGQ